MNDVIKPVALPSVTVTIDRQAVNIRSNLAESWQVVKLLAMALHVACQQEDKKRQGIEPEKVIRPYLVVPKVRGDAGKG